MLPITRRYIVDHLDLDTARLAGKWYVDWILANTKLLAYNVVAFVLSNGTFKKVYPSESKQKMPENIYLNDFCDDVRIPEGGGVLIVIGPQIYEGGTLHS